MILTNADLESMKNAIELINKGMCKRVDLGNDTLVYKVPTSSDPKKYTIRMDIKVKEE